MFKFFKRDGYRDTPLKMTLNLWKNSSALL